jgi:hypothetical protein
MIPPRLIFAAVALLVWASSASADLTSACFRDYLRFCGTVVPGEGRVAKCLNANRASLSPTCGEAFAAVASCRPEIERYCSSLAEPAQIKTCLQGKTAQLGETCRQNLSRF